MNSVLIPSQNLITIASEYQDMAVSNSVNELVDKPSDRSLPLIMMGLPNINKSR